MNDDAVLSLADVVKRLGDGLKLSSADFASAVAKLSEAFGQVGVEKPFVIYEEPELSW